MFDVTTYLSKIDYYLLLRLAILLFIGLPLIHLASGWIQRYAGQKHSPQQGMIFSKALKYSGVILVLVMVLKELGFELSPLLGAAGIIGIAIGFASQTSVSNIISGLFLIAEKPFVVDDTIMVGNTIGMVLSIDILSVKIRTFDNKFVRIPNETLIKSEVTTFTRFPIRRLDLPIGVAYKENLDQVRQTLLNVAHQNPLCLEEPEAEVRLAGYGHSAIDLLFVVWTAKDDYLKLKNMLLEEVKKAFDENGIEIPFPHLSLYTGSVTEPFPVKIISSTPGEAKHE